MNLIDGRQQLAAGTAAVSAGSTDRAAIAALERVLQSNASATRALETWCAARGLSHDPVITARQVTSAPAAEPHGLRDRLGVTADAELGYRHVELLCGDRILSVAHNWYRRDVLTEAMHEALASGDTPFGKVVAPLHFTRETIASCPAGDPGCPPGAILSQVALLRLPDGHALALVTECYTRAALGQ